LAARRNREISGADDLRQGARRMRGTALDPDG
jgi:hypothetical protein